MSSANIRARECDKQLGRSFIYNLGRLLVDRLSVNVQGVEVYQNIGESMMEVYKDLWRSDEDRDNRQEFGLANENVRKLVSKDDSGNKATKTDGVLDLTIANMCDRMKIPLGKILGDQGRYAPYGMFDFEYRITLPQSKKILKAQDGEDKGEYKLTDLHLEYEVIESEDLVREVKGRKVLGLRLHDIAENFELEEGLHEASHRREHPEKKHESHRPAVHESWRGG